MSLWLLGTVYIVPLSLRVMKMITGKKFSWKNLLFVVLGIQLFIVAVLYWVSSSMVVVKLLLVLGCVEQERVAMLSLRTV